jgi:hypothetical protein
MAVIEKLLGGSMQRHRPLETSVGNMRRHWGQLTRPLSMIGERTRFRSSPARARYSVKRKRERLSVAILGMSLARSGGAC